MNQDRWLHIKAQFQKALRMEGGERKEFLEQVGTEDPEDRFEIESLLASHDESESFLERAPSQIAAEVLEQAGDGHPVSEQPSPRGRLVGQRLGPYKILRHIGHGGLGSVYLAAREEEFRKQVAIKLIRRTVATPDLQRRFEFERQILATIEHPNIARLLDGGTTEEGLPFLVMEYIDGEPIDRFCDRHRLPIRQRLRLFTSVCQAVAMAHRNLVVHCDIKPDNVLVTEDGTPKLLDFGIARILGSELAGTQVGTQLDDTKSGPRILTPDYASPEQLRGDPITTSSDIYSLGVLLYELLAGARPYSVGDLVLDEASRAVSKVRPRRPSTLSESSGPPLAGTPTPNEVVDEAKDGVTDDAAVERTAVDRSTTPARLKRELSGDLDCISLRALQREPSHRYSSVDELAHDVESYLTGFPIVARQAGLSYRMAKFVGRHRLAVTTAAASLVALLAFLGLLGFQSARLAEARDRAEREAASAKIVSDFLQGMLTNADPYEGIGGDATVLESLDLAVADIEEALAGQPELEAAVRDAAGMTYLQLGRYADAEPQLSKGLEIRRGLDAGQDLNLVRSLNHVGRLKQEQGDYEGAEILLREALAVSRQGKRADQALMAETIARLATIRHDRGDLARAQDLYLEALEMRRALFGNENSEVATSLDDLGNLLQDSGKLELAEARYREALSIRQRLLDAGHPDISTSLNNLGAILHDRESLDEAEVLYRDSLEMARGRFGDEHPEVATAHNNLATLLHDKGELEGAERHYRKSLDLARKVHGDAHPEVATGLNNLASLLHDQGKLAEAENHYRESIEMARHFFGNAHVAVAENLENLAFLLEERGDLAGAEAALDEALEITRRAVGEEHRQTALSLATAASLVCGRGDSERASTTYLQAIAMLERVKASEELVTEIKAELEECRTAGAA